MMDMMKAFVANGGQNLIDRVTESWSGSQELLHTKLNWPILHTGIPLTLVIELGTMPQLLHLASLSCRRALMRVTLCLDVMFMCGDL